MWLPAFIKQIKGVELLVKLDQSINLEHLKTMYNGDLSKIYARIEIVDPRKARPAQRKLFFALCNDIQSWAGAPMKDFLKDFFYTTYAIENDGAEISLADGTNNSVSDANKLLDIVIDFMFEWSVPFKQGYELLPRDENYFLYQCCKHRKCVVCGKHADIHHMNGSTVGAGSNRNKIDHTKRYVLPLCRVDHNLIHSQGEDEFCKMNHLPIRGIKLDVETLKKIGVKGDYREEEQHGS